MEKIIRWLVTWVFSFSPWKQAPQAAALGGDEASEKAKSGTETRSHFDEGMRSSLCVVEGGRSADGRARCAAADAPEEERYAGDSTRFRAAAKGFLQVSGA